MPPKVLNSRGHVVFTMPISFSQLLLSAKSWRICIMTGLASKFGSQPFLVIFELPH